MVSIAGGLFSKVIDINDIRLLRELFEVSASYYWNDHFVFGKKSKDFTKKTGSQAADILIINAVIPVLFVYGQSRDRQDLCDRTISLLENIKAEENKILKEWESSGLIAESAFYSQALIQLRNEYCKKRRCLDCRIGKKLISMGKKLRDHNELVLEP
jgi:hypothetical protein